MQRRWDIRVMMEDRLWAAAVPGAEAMVRRAARLSLAAVGAPPGGLTLVLADDAALRDLNRRFRGKDWPTNVLSFPDLPRAGRFGDVILARQTLLREAVRQGKRPIGHLAHLVVHAVLHLFGYDHDRLYTAECMEWQERRILAHLSLPDPYRAGAARSGAGRHDFRQIAR